MGQDYFLLYFNNILQLKIIGEDTSRGCITEKEFISLILFFLVFHHFSLVFAFALRDVCLQHPCWEKAFRLPRDDGDVRALRCNFRRLHFRTGACFYVPQINGSCTMSQIVAVLFSHFRSIRRGPSLCTSTSDG